MYNIVTVNTNAISSNIIKENLVEIATLLQTAENDSKTLAHHFHTLKNCPDFGDEFKGADFKTVIDTIFHGAYSGNTAYKYAQMYEIFHNNAEFWELFTMGKLIALSPLETEKRKKSGISAEKFVVWYAGVINEKLYNAHAVWAEDNAQMLAQIAVLEESGTDASNLRALLPSEPPRPLEFDESDPDSIDEYGRRMRITALAELARGMSDKALKEEVKRYLSEMEPKTTKTEKAKTEKAEKPEAEKPDEIDYKARLITALQEYAETLENVPAEIKDFSEWLENA